MILFLSRMLYPTRVKKALSLSQFFAGEANGKSIDNFDLALQKIRGKSKAIAGLEWSPFGEDGVERRQKSGHYI